MPYIDLVDLNAAGDSSRVRPHASVSNNPIPYNFTMPDPERDSCDEPESKLQDEMEQEDSPGQNYPPEQDNSVPTVLLVRPSISYHGLIAMAILSSPTKKMTVEQICGYVSEKFPFYQRTEPAWRPFIKHTLALTGLFREVKCGTDCCWTIRKNCLDLASEFHAQ